MWQLSSIVIFVGINKGDSGSKHVIFFNFLIFFGTKEATKHIIFD